MPQVCDGIEVSNWWLIILPFIGWALLTKHLHISIQYLRTKVTVSTNTTLLFKTFLNNLHICSFVILYFGMVCFDVICIYKNYLPLNVSQIIQIVVKRPYLVKKQQIYACCVSILTLAVILIWAIDTYYRHAFRLRPYSHPWHGTTDSSWSHVLQSTLIFRLIWSVVLWPHKQAVACLNSVHCFLTKGFCLAYSMTNIKVRLENDAKWDGQIWKPQLSLDRCFVSL